MKQTHSERVSLSNSRSSSSLPFSGGAVLHRVSRVFVSLSQIQLALNLIQSDSPLLHHLPFFALFAPRLDSARHKFKHSILLSNASNEEGALFSKAIKPIANMTGNGCMIFLIVFEGLVEVRIEWSLSLEFPSIQLNLRCMKYNY
jgi:hypothetical protein